MAEDYAVTLRITVTKGKPDNLVTSEDTGFQAITFARMTHISAEFFELTAKLAKEKV